MKAKIILFLLIFTGACLFPLSAYSAQGDGTGGGGGDGTNPGPKAPPGAQDAPGPGEGIGPISMTKPKLDQLYDWAEETYPQFFPNPQISVTIEGYYARYYPTTDIYIGAKDKQVYVLGQPFGGLLHVDSFVNLVRLSGI